ncbi:hypothetical protein G6F64_015416 [Rhizopus arrhizus]|uniref:Uncharacterized protein n=1 Tax=Rhizopus oryzae TaxID=64495 RepID=A0A9P6WRJ3_RHIOR|nr:hypothetical protein G6F64_015416 [Rhizopus arrhizus]
MGPLENLCPPCSPWGPAPPPPAGPGRAASPPNSVLNAAPPGPGARVPVDGSRSATGAGARRLLRRRFAHTLLRGTGLGCLLRGGTA